jgi:hypothetical protein
MHANEGQSPMQTLGFASVNEEIGVPLAASLAPVEYGYYFVIFYTVLGIPLGLILTGGIGSGFLLIPVAALCVVALGLSFMKVLQMAWIPLACGASYLFIQLALHGESMYAMYVYQFGPWLFSVIIVQALVMHRPNFLHRFAWFMVVMGLATLPFMTVSQAGEYQRFGMERGVGNSNPNAVAATFGFCALYLAIKGYVETRPAYRIAAWIVAVTSMYVVTLTVSRGALVAVAASLLVAGRRLWKTGVFPLLFFATLVAGLIQFGVFDQAIDSYSRRAGEETGRLKVWPLLIERFVDSPVIGVGASRAGAWIRPDKYTTPHNSFLLFAVASGIVPLVLFSLYCYKSGMTALRASIHDKESMFYLPLVVYTVLITSSGNMDFMAPWAVVSLAVPSAVEVRRLISKEPRKLRTSQLGHEGSDEA